MAYLWSLIMKPYLNAHKWKYCVVCPLNYSKMESFVILSINSSESCVVCALISCKWDMCDVFS